MVCELEIHPDHAGAGGCNHLVYGLDIRPNQARGRHHVVHSKTDLSEETTSPFKVFEVAWKKSTTYSNSPEKKHEILRKFREISEAIPQVL